MLVFETCIIIVLKMSIIPKAGYTDSKQYSAKVKTKIIGCTMIFLAENTEFFLTEVQRLNFSL